MDMDSTLRIFELVWFSCRQNIWIGGCCSKTICNDVPHFTLRDRLRAQGLGASGKKKEKTKTI